MRHMHHNLTKGGPTVGPEDWRSVGLALALIISGAGGAAATVGIQRKKLVVGAPPREPDETGSAVLAGMDAMNEKMERLLQNQQGIKLELGGLREDVDRHNFVIGRLSRSQAELSGRIDGIQERGSRPT